MKTDNRFFQFFQLFPEATFTLLGLENLPFNEFVFDSITSKSVELEVDGFYRPLQESLPYIFIEVYGYKDPFAFKKLVGESMIYLKQNKLSDCNYLMFLIFTHQDLDCGDTLLELLKQSDQFHVIYLDEIVENLPNSPFFTLIKLMVTDNNVERDLEIVETSYKRIEDPTIQNNFLEQCLSALLDKYKTLDRQLLKSMWDPTKPFQVSESLAVRQYAQEYAQPFVEKALYFEEKAHVFEEKAHVFEKSMTSAVNKLYHEKKFSVQEISTLLNLSEAEVGRILNL